MQVLLRTKHLQGEKGRVVAERGDSVKGAFGSRLRGFLSAMDSNALPREADSAEGFEPRV